MKKLTLTSYLIIGLLVTQSTLFSSQEFLFYKRLFGQKAEFMVGYSGNIRALIELVKESIGSNSSVLCNARNGLIKGGLLTLSELLKSYFQNHITQNDLIKKLEDLNNSYCYDYESKYGEEDAAYQIGLHGDINALYELIKKCDQNRKTGALYDAQFGLDDGEFYELNLWLKLYMKDKITREELIKRMDAFKDSRCYSYRKLAGGKAFVEMGKLEDVEALIEMLKRCGNNRLALALCDIRFGLHQGGHRLFYKLFEQYVKYEITQEELISQLNEQVAQQILNRGRV